MDCMDCMDCMDLRERLEMKRTRLGTGTSQLQLVKDVTKLKKDKPPTETYEQIKLATWLDRNGIRFYAVPNGGWRSMTEAIKFKRCGVKAGVPDLCIPLPVEPYHGLYIELKRLSGSKTSEEQVEWLNFLQSKGYYAVVCKGFDEAKRVVEYYLSLSPKSVA